MPPLPYLTLPLYPCLFSFVTCQAGQSVPWFALSRISVAQTPQHVHKHGNAESVHFDRMFRLNACSLSLACSSSGPLVRCVTYAVTRQHKNKTVTCACGTSRTCMHSFALCPEAQRHAQAGFSSSGDCRTISSPQLRFALSSMPINMADWHACQFTASLQHLLLLPNFVWGAPFVVDTPSCVCCFCHENTRSNMFKA